MKAEQTVAINNRKYLGSKHRLLGFLEETILAVSPQIGLFVDAFSGTGVVANRFRQHAQSVVANDLLYSNYVTIRAFLSGDSIREETVSVIDRLNGLGPRPGYAATHFGGTYFTQENAALIDAVRDELAEILLDEDTHISALASLLYAADKVANTAGQYDAFLKNLGQSEYDDNGRHVVDTSVYKRLHLRVPQVDPGAPCKVYNDDFNDIAGQLDADVLYLDPPYNSRQYSDLYHVLESIAVWNKPVVHGKTKKFDRRHLKSAYSSRLKCGKALAELIGKARAQHIFLSYNSEGLLDQDDIQTIMELKGPTQVYQTDYGVFGNGAGRAVKRTVKERLFHCRVRR